MEEWANTSDEDLVKVYQAGQLEALDALWMRHESWLYRYLFFLLGREAEAQDLIQEAFMRVYRHLGKMEFSTSYRAWLQTIARNLAFNYLQKKGNQPHRDLDDFTSVLEMVGEGMPSHLKDELQGCLAELSERDRALVLMRHQGDMTLQDLSLLFDLSIEGVRKAVARGLDALRSCMERKGWEDGDV